MAILRGASTGRLLHQNVDIAQASGDVSVASNWVALLEVAPREEARLADPVSLGSGYGLRDLELLRPGR